MTLDLMVHAADQATFRAGMVDYGFAVIDDAGNWSPIPDAAIDEIGSIVKTPAGLDEAGNVVTPAVLVEGWHVNVRVVGALAAQVTAGLPQVNGDGSLKSIFERTHILAMLPGLVWEPIPTAQGVPAGYQLANGTRLYDPAMVSSPSRVWA